MPRFFVNTLPGKGDSGYLLDGEEGRHGAKVLRLKAGEEVTLCDGEGMDCLCRVEKNTGESLLLLPGKCTPSRGEAEIHTTVCQCLPKGDKLETVTQKAVELGAWEIWPIESRYCVTRWDQKSREKKRIRLQKIAREAAMQSGRGIVPQVLGVARLRSALEAAAREGEILFFYERGRVGLQSCLQGLGNRIFLFIGPEGGFSEEEASWAEELGAKIASLGPRILRTETASLAALSAILFARGEMEP